MKVLHLIKTSVGATWAFRQIRELVSLGVIVHVALPPGGPMVGKYSEIGAFEHLLQTDFPIQAPWRFHAFKKSFLKLIETIQPDILHSHFVGTTLLMRLSLWGDNTLPRVFQVPGPLHLEHSFFRRGELAVSGPADFWIGSCRWTCQRYKSSGIPSGKIFLSYYGADIDLFFASNPGKLRNELGLSSECKIIGMVAYMYAPKKILGQRRGIKGHEDLIDAFKICLKKNPHLRCVMVGGPWNNATSYESNIQEYARQNCGDKVIFLGTRRDIADIYANFDVAVHPSLSENVGGAVESLLLGIPTIATNVGGFPDLVQENKTGWLVPPKNPKILAEVIEKVLDDPMGAKKIATSGQSLARTLFDVKKTAREIKIIYDLVLRCMA